MFRMVRQSLVLQLSCVQGPTRKARVLMASATWTAALKMATALTRFTQHGNAGQS